MASPSLHAGWTSDDRLDLWAENAPAFVQSISRKTRASKSISIRPHPFAMSGSELQEALGLHGVGEPSDLLLALPSSAHGPRPSPFLRIDEALDLAEPTGLLPWTVPSLSLSPGEALDLLLRLPSAPFVGFRPGNTLAFFSALARFAVELCARGSCVPTLVRAPAANEAGKGVEDDDADFEARWRAWTEDEADASRVEDLVRAVPPVARAALPNVSRPRDLPELGCWAGAAPRDLVRRVLDAFVDDVARQALAQHPIFRTRSKKHLAHEAWLLALCREDATIASTPAELKRLAKTLDAWTGPGNSRKDAFRTCFRVHAPEAPETSWGIEFVLQARDDPSLLVTATDIWANRDGRLVLGQRYLQDPQETLLGDLGRALRLFPPLEKALLTPRPSGLQADPALAWRFLSEAAPLLVQAGFGVVLPPWWGTTSARLGARLRLSSGREEAGRVGLGLHALVAFRWEVALAGEVLSYEEFRRIAALKVPLVQIRGRWVELRPEDLAAATALFDTKKLEGSMSLRDALHVGASSEQVGHALPLLGLDAEGWLGDLLAEARETRAAEIATPALFQGTLRPYQERGLGWLSFMDRLGLGAILADDMGLGKTIELLALLVKEREGPDTGPTLLVCPMSVVANWRREAARFAPLLRVLVHHGPDRASGEALREAAEAADLVLTTYALAARDQEALSSIAWHRLVLDEAQNVKNVDTRQSRAVRALPAPHRVALTGTPVENRLSELWSIMEFLNPGLLGSQATFRKSFSIPVERYQDRGASDRLRRLTSPFILRRLKTDKSIIRDLPDKFEIKVFCTLCAEQATLYQAVLDEMLSQVSGARGIQRKGLVLATLARLKQVCNHPAHYLRDRSALPGRSGKLARLEEILEEVIANGEKALIFTQYAEMGALLRGHFQDRLGRDVLFLHGELSARAREEVIQRFQDSAGPPLFVLSLKAGGTGLNLTAANHVIHFDRWWNPAVEDQATDRAFRIGQTRDVQVRKLVCVGTLEERIDAMIESKKCLAGQVIGEGEAWISELDDAGFRALCALSADAVAED